MKKDKKRKIAIFIPARNAAHTLPLVIDRIPKSVKEKVTEIFIIDNASKDSTYLTAVGYKADRGFSKLSIIKNKKDIGYGGSQKKAYKYVIDKGYDIVVMLHGDAQYAPEMITRLLTPIEKGNADMVFGSRMSGNPLKGGMPIIKYLGNRYLTAIENYVLDLDLSEYHSGYRAFSVAALKKVPFHLCTSEYFFDTEILIQFRLKDFRIKEGPIPTHYGEESHHPSISQLFSYSYNILKALLAYQLHVKGLRKSRKFNV